MTDQFVLLVVNINITRLWSTTDDVTCKIIPVFKRIDSLLGVGRREVEREVRREVGRVGNKRERERQSDV